MKQILGLIALMFCLPMSAQHLKEGRLEGVVQLTHDNARYEAPQFSPNGQFIAFTNYGYDNLYVMNADGSNQHRISDKKGVGFRFQWSIDSREIIGTDISYTFVGNKRQRRQAAWAFTLDGNSQRLTRDATRMKPATWRYSANGQRRVLSLDAIAIERQEFVPQAMVTRAAEPTANIGFICDPEGLWVVDPSGNKSLINAGPSFCPVLSPDGSCVTFNHLNDVCTINIDGSNKRILDRGFNPTWVGNTQIVYEKSTDDGHTYTSSDLFIINADGSNPRNITNSSNLMEMCPSVSPDGSMIVFTNFSNGQVYCASLK